MACEHGEVYRCRRCDGMLGPGLEDKPKTARATLAKITANESTAYAGPRRYINVGGQVTVFYGCIQCTMKDIDKNFATFIGLGRDTGLEYWKCKHNHAVREN